jgi:hypothetical protein
MRVCDVKISVVYVVADAANAKVVDEVLGCRVIVD